MTRLSVAALVAVSVFAVGASAQPQPMRPKASKNVICPAQVQVKFVAANPGALGSWSVNDGPFFVQLDPANPPHFSGGNMTCYYKLGSQPGAFNIYQPIGNWKCSVLTNGTGFVCTQ
jgi:hypothetical protein